MKFIIRLFIFYFIVCFPLFAQDKFEVNEDQFYSDPDTVVQKENPVNPEMENFINKKSLGISGEIVSVFPYMATRDYVLNGESQYNEFNPYMFGNVDFDARLPQNYKGFANIDAEYHPDTDESEAFIKELFVDFNFSKKVYFRAGKQVLQWGRCYLWNPTDVINIEKTSFQTRVQSREGTYGLKMTVPFGTSVNMYGFADMYKNERASDTGGAFKLEFLFGNTEMAFSGWGKKNYHPVYGYDFSTRIFGLDLVGEASCSYGSNYDKVRVVNGGTTLETYREEDKWIPKASVNVGREFDGADIPNRYSLKFEFFYNGAGYKDNIFDDDTTYPFAAMKDDNEDWVVVPLPMDKKTYMLANDLYEPNCLSRYYAAVFTSMERLFIEEITLNLNGIMNITDLSYIVSLGLAYQNINDFKAGLTLNTYLGEKNGEYTMDYNGAVRAVEVLATAGIIF